MFLLFTDEENQDLETKKTLLLVRRLIVSVNIYFLLTVLPLMWRIPKRVSLSSNSRDREFDRPNLLWPRGHSRSAVTMGLTFVLGVPVQAVQWASGHLNASLLLSHWRGGDRIRSEVWLLSSALLLPKGRLIENCINLTCNKEYLPLFQGPPILAICRLLSCRFYLHIRPGFWYGCILAPVRPSGF